MSSDHQIIGIENSWQGLCSSFFDSLTRNDLDRLFEPVRTRWLSINAALPWDYAAWLRLFGSSISSPPMEEALLVQKGVVTTLDQLCLYPLSIDSHPICPSPPPTNIAEFSYYSDKENNMLFYYRTPGMSRDLDCDCMPVKERISLADYLPILGNYTGHTALSTMTQRPLTLWMNMNKTKPDFGSILGHTASQPGSMRPKEGWSLVSMGFLTILESYNDWMFYTRSLQVDDAGDEEEGLGTVEEEQRLGTVNTIPQRWTDYLRFKDAEERKERLKCGFVAPEDGIPPVPDNVPVKWWVDAHRFMHSSEKVQKLVGNREYDFVHWLHVFHNLVIYFGSA